MPLLDQLLQTIPIERGQAGSKKRALQALSTLLAGGGAAISEHQVFDGLVARERLGSTGLGFGVAIPHGRLAGIEHTVGALLVLESGVDFDAPDGLPVDLLFGLLVPEACNDEHLQILAGLAELFGNAQLRSELRASDDPEVLREALFAGRAHLARSA